VNIASLHRDAMQALTGELDKQEVHRLTNMASHFADMVGWAPGVIDPDGQVHSAFGDVQAAARKRFEADQNPDVAALHDAIADLIDAVARHDKDLTPSQDDDDDIVGV